MKLLLASGNEHKIYEFKKLFRDYENIEILSLKDLNDNNDVDETGTTFSENSFIKAKYFYDKYNIVTISDDSGIVVPSLNYEPGVYSARYSGLGDEGNNDLLLKKLGNSTDRVAYYECDICFYDGKEEKHFNGKCYGEIGYERKGTNGFGYDPLFIYEDKTFAEVDLETKNKVSHRAVALRQFMEYFEKEYLK